MCNFVCRMSDEEAAREEQECKARPTSSKSCSPSHWAAPDPVNTSPHGSCKPPRRTHCHKEPLQRGLNYCPPDGRYGDDGARSGTHRNKVLLNVGLSDCSLNLFTIGG